MLSEKGFTNAAALLGGFNEWTRENLPTEGSESKKK